MLLSSLDGLSALIVEDEALIAMAYADMLKAAQCTVVGCVATADAAVTSALRHAPNFVLMDVRLRGDRTGLDAAEEIRARGATFPIIFATACSQPEDIRRMRQIARSDIPSKPVSYVELGKAIRRSDAWP